jgi:hypothetical protein
MRSRHHTLRSIRALASLLALATLTSPGVAPVRASPAPVGVSLVRGWVHLPTVAPGLVFTGAYNDVQIVAGGPGLVVYEQQGGGFRMYASATGRDWAQLPSPAFRPGEIAHQLFIVGQRFIITGSSPSTGGFVPRIWASVNGGRRWQDSPAHLQISAVTSGGEGLIAFVSARSPTQLWMTQLWTSTNGVTWRQLRVANKTFASAQVISVTRGGPGYVAGGFISEAGTPSRGTIWTSLHGLAWTEVPHAGTVFAGSATGISQVVAGPAGVAAVGEVAGPTLRDAIWASREGTHWRRADDSFVTTPGLPSLPLAVWQGGFAEIQDTGTGAELYASQDGLSWTRMGSDDLFGGSAWVTGMIGFHGGLAAVGGFALHPGPTCLPEPGVATGGLVTPKPSVLLWSPHASQTTPALTLDPSDPRALRLLPQDFPSDFFGPLGPHPYQGQYVNLCGFLPALGRHRAYLVRFDSGARGLALDIVTQRTAAAEAAFAQVERLVATLPWVTKVQRLRELQGTARVGDETRVFTIHVKDYECGDLERTAGVFGDLECTTVYYSASVVVWRHGQVIGMVVANQGRSFAMKLARELLVRSEHPSD